MAILEAITGTRIYLDTNIFIYAVEGYAQFQAELNETNDKRLEALSDLDVVVLSSLLSA